MRLESFTFERETFQFNFFSTENVSETIFGWNVSQKIALIAKIFDVTEVFANSKVNYSKIAQKTGQD